MAADCVLTFLTKDNSGNYVVAFGLDSTFTTGADPSACTSGQFLVGVDEVNAISASAANPLNLSVSDGALISGAIAGVWVLAYCFRAIARTFDSSSTSE